MNIGKDTTELSFVQQRLHGVSTTCQSYSPFNNSEHTCDSANVTSQSAVLSLASTATTNCLNDSTSLASDIDSRTSCPTTRTGPMPVEVTTVAKQQMPVELIITAPQHPQIHLIRCKHSQEVTLIQPIQMREPDTTDVTRNA
ncbi:hypothetical protein Tco_0251162 [Tanacetum coccineum]